MYVYIHIYIYIPISGNLLVSFLSLVDPFNDLSVTPGDSSIGSCLFLTTKRSERSGKTSAQLWSEEFFLNTWYLLGWWCLRNHCVDIGVIPGVPKFVIFEACSPQFFSSNGYQLKGKRGDNPTTTKFDDACEHCWSFRTPKITSGGW